MSGFTGLRLRYDAVHRLLSADLPDAINDVAYSYDGVGNRKTEASAAGTRHYLYGDGNRLLEIRDGTEQGPLLRSFTYNGAGEVASKRDGAGNLLYALERSSQGRVVGVSGLSFSPQSLGYDPLGLRVRRTVNATGGANQRFHLEGEHLEAIYTAAGALRAKFLRGSVIDEVVNGYYYLGTAFKPTNYTYHHDPLQSVVGISSPTGEMVQTLRYGPFGNLLASTGTSSSTLRYTGREHDSVSGLYYYRARYYDPEIGRFLSEDPLGFGGGDVNLYAYVGNNPLLFSDPRGECPICLVPLGKALLLSGGVIAGGGAVGLGVSAAVGESTLASTNTSPKRVSEFREGLAGTALIVGGVAGVPAATGGALIAGETLLTSPTLTGFVVDRIPIVAAGTHLASQRPQGAVGVDQTIGFVQDPSGALRAFDRSLARSAERVSTAVDRVSDMLEFLLTPGPIESGGYPSEPSARTTTRAYRKP